MAQRAVKSKGITIVQGGDAGTAEGDFATCLVWSSRKGNELPLLILVTNNKWGISTHWDGQHGESRIADRGKAFGMPTATIDGNDNVWISNFAAPNSPITQLCGVHTENCPPGMKTGDQISPPGGYVGGGLQMQTDLAVGPAGDVWVMNNWEDIESCFGVPPEELSTRCGGQGVTI